MRPGEESNISSVYQTETKTTGIEGELAETSTIVNQIKVECEYFIALGKRLDENVRTQRNKQFVVRKFGALP